MVTDTYIVGRDPEIHAPRPPVWKVLLMELFRFVHTRTFISFKYCSIAEGHGLSIPKRTIHTHARVGYSQGPQVPHPGAPEFEQETTTHEGWWSLIVQWRGQTGNGLTFTPEFGPLPYMPRLPFTNQPVADLWQVCLWMKERFERNVL